MKYPLTLKIILVPVFLLMANAAFAQNAAVFVDLKACTESYIYGAEVAEKLEENFDTSTFYHDKEMVIFFNQDESKHLSANTFYIFNHGFNKLLSFRVSMMQIEASNNKKDKKTFMTAPDAGHNVYQQDSLTRCSYMIAGLQGLQIKGYKKSKITAVFVEFQYYDKHIYKWFLNKPDIPEDLIYLKWNEEN